MATENQVFRLLSSGDELAARLTEGDDLVSRIIHREVPGAIGRKQTELFGQKPRRPRQWRMHVLDAGTRHAELMVRFLCVRCGHETDWMYDLTITEAKRGIPCPVCNAPRNN